MPPTHRPQTLRQAKKAYRKSGATVRLSESELAIIERRGVLQERADRIKEREARRKANIKRKEERIQREREARARMGIKEPIKDGITPHVGPSQLSLGGFFGGQGKRKRHVGAEEENDGSRITTEATRAETEFWREQEERNCHIPLIQRTPWRNPLKVVSANSTARKTPPECSATADALAAKSSLTWMAPPSSSHNCFHPKSPSSRVQPRIPPATAQRAGAKIPERELDKHEDCQAMVTPLPPLQTPFKVILPQPFTKQKPLYQPKGAERSIREGVKTERCPAILMAPPPRCAAPQCRPSDKNTQQKPSITAAQHQSSGTVDECWGDLFVSGTQIERELSPPLIKVTLDAPPAACFLLHPSTSPSKVLKNEVIDSDPGTIPKLPPPPRPPSQFRKALPVTPEDDTAGLLDLISTQDLDFSGVLTQAAPHIVQDDTDDLLAQISTQDLKFSGELTQIAPQAPSIVSSDFDEDLTEEDLEDVALEFERDFTLVNSRTTIPHPERTTLEGKREDEHVAHEIEEPKDLKRGSSANITAMYSFEDEDGIGTHAFDEAVEGYLDFLQMQEISFEHSLDDQIQQPSEDSDDDWGEFPDGDIIPDKSPTLNIGIESEQEGKAEKDVKPCVSRTSSQIAGNAAEYDAFDLSTQDLRDFEYESLNCVP